MYTARHFYQEKGARPARPGIFPVEGQNMPFCYEGLALEVSIRKTGLRRFNGIQLIRGKLMMFVVKVIVTR